MINCNENGVRAKFRAVTEASRAPPCAAERRGRRKNLPIQSTIIAEPHDYNHNQLWCGWMRHFLGVTLLRLYVYETHSMTAVSTSDLI